MTNEKMTIRKSKSVKQNKTSNKSEKIIKNEISVQNINEKTDVNIDETDAHLQQLITEHDDYLLKLTGIENQIYNLETAYLQKSFMLGHGNICSGWGKPHDYLYFDQVPENEKNQDTMSEIDDTNCYKVDGGKHSIMSVSPSLIKKYPLLKSDKTKKQIIEKNRFFSYSSVTSSWDRKLCEKNDLSVELFNI